MGENIEPFSRASKTQLLLSHRYIITMQIESQGSHGTTATMDWGNTRAANKRGGVGSNLFCIQIPIYTSRKNSTNELELLAVVKAVDRYKHYLLEKNSSLQLIIKT